METIRNNKKEMLEIKNIVTEMKNACARLIRRLGTAEEKISELADTATETSHTEN